VTASELQLEGVIRFKVDTEDLESQIAQANRQATSGGRAKPGAAGGGDAGGAAAGKDGQVIANSIKNSLAGLKMPLPAPISNISSPFSGGLPPGLVFAAGRVTAGFARPPAPVPVPPPSGAAGAAVGRGLASRIGLAGLSVGAPAIAATAGVAAIGLGAKVAADALTKGVDKRIERQLGAGFQFSPELSALAFQREVRQRDRAITRGRILGESAQDLQRERDKFSGISNVLTSGIDREVNELLLSMLRIARPVWGEIVEAIVRIGNGVGALTKDEMEDMLRALAKEGVDVSDPGPAYTPPEPYVQWGMTNPGRMM
jgi:hypothetical protein